MSWDELPQHGRILVVDDAMENIHALHSALQEDGHEVVFALDGRKAVEMAHKQAPDLILLDALMPEPDGYAVCAELQADPATRDIPVIFVTALSRPEDETRALAAGAVDFIPKPVNVPVLQARVRTHLTLKRQRDKLREASAWLNDHNEALQRSNQDLQHFAHLAAHDLQAPLNAIAGCTRLLSEECAGKMSPQAEQYMGFVLDNTYRMQTLIKDLLAYAQLDAQAKHPEAASLAKLFDEVRFILSSQIAAKGVDISSSDLPILTVDRYQISQLLMNLIENGIKYNRADQPRIRVSARREGQEWLIAVEDNGIGIDPQHHHRIFEIFRRLHSASAYPGSGIGLAICQRIVSRHGGRIWVESQEGQGSTFYFTLPADDEPAAAP